MSSQLAGGHASSRTNNKFFLLFLTACVVASIVSEWYMLTSKLHQLERNHLDLTAVVSHLQADHDACDKLIKEQTNEHDHLVKILDEKVRHLCEKGQGRRVPACNSCPPPSGGGLTGGGPGIEPGG